MAEKRVKVSVKKKRGVLAKRGKGKLLQVASSGAPFFVYRGLKIKPSFKSDERAKELELLMREYASRAHVFSE
ncbi:hypothetical protein [Novosphingobium sediminicola]|uniref:Uncharacterized protein n=1 Tax=Novosphingobium sediminicola TaxID=563162 RepID=A0A7W6CEX2_9SPHN|nr:hypothetical protein [Novosphingobium sediminicola]MBB3953404.1 hypothetical protein [Novosphingobium sediminicola]